MNILTRPIAATLALTVSASLSLALVHDAPAVASTARSGAAHSTHAAARADSLHVDVIVKKHRIIRSTNGFRPGNTVFDLRLAGGAVAAVELLRLRTGYTFADFRHDIDSDSLAAIRRIDRRVVFYGGMPVYKNRVTHFAASLNAGRYFLFDVDHPRWVRLRVEGPREHRSLPETTGSVDMVMDHQDQRFLTPWRLPRSGWLKQTNRTDEPHFMDMVKVKRSTTWRQVHMAFAGRGPDDPNWLLHNYPGTFVVSPGRTVEWRYSYPRGKYLEMCFWPSSDDGMSHAEMGMWHFVTLH